MTYCMHEEVCGLHKLQTCSRASALLLLLWKGVVWLPKMLDGCSEQCGRHHTRFLTDMGLTSLRMGSHSATNFQNGESNERAPK